MLYNFVPIARGKYFSASLFMTLAFLGWTVAQKRGQPDAATIDCLSCIAYACMGNATDPPCGEYCGRYLISNAYWIDAGKPGKVADFKECASNLRCAENTIVAYMNKYGTDCDGDGEVSCGDYARMHKLGRSDCTDPAINGTLYWSQFVECRTRRRVKDVCDCP